MNTPTISTGVSCYIMVPPSYSPQLVTAITHIGGDNLRCYPAHSVRGNLSEIALQDGSTDIYRLGPDRHDVVLEVTGASDETQMVIEEIIRRGLPVLIYPRAEARAQMLLPLVRSIAADGDGMTVTQTYNTVSGTTVFLPRADARRQIRMEAVAAGQPLLMDGMPSLGTSNAVPCPIGRGAYFPKAATNLIKDSEFGAINYEAPLPADGWRWTAGGGTWNTHAGRKSSPWHDGYSYWTKSTNNYLTSHKFSLVTTNTQSIHLSLCYRVSGAMAVTVRDSGGTALYTQTVNHGTGRLNIGIPATATGTEADCTLRIALTSGEYAEVACPQLISVSPDSISEYEPYLSTSTAVQGGITQYALLIEGDYGMDNIGAPATAGDHNGLICISGYAQPSFSAATSCQHTLAFLQRFLGAADGDVELRLCEAGTSYEAAIYSGGTRRDGATITTPVRGEVLAWVLYTGRVGGALATGARVVNVRTGDAYNLSWTDGGLGYANQLYIGARSTAGYGSNCIVSAVSVSSAPGAVTARDIATRLANAEVTDLFRRTIGRWYRLEAQVSPRRYDRQGWEGSYLCREVKAI